MDLFLLHCLVLTWTSFGTSRRLAAALADRLLAAALLAWANIVMTSLLLATIHRMGQPAWFLGGSGLLAILTGLLSAKIIPEPAPTQQAKANPWLVAVFVAVCAAFGLAVVVIAGVYPPNTPEAFSYHLPRAMYYLGQGSLGHFDAVDLRLTHLPFNYDLLQVFGLVYSPPATCLNVFNVLAWALCGVASHRLSRLCALGPNVALAASGLALTALPVLAQATTVADDLPAGVSLLGALIFGLRWQQTGLARHALLAGLAAGLAAGTSPGIWLFALPALVLLARRRWQHKRSGPELEFAVRRTWLLASLVALVTVVPFALINVMEGGQGLIPTLSQLSHRPGAEMVRTLFAPPLANTLNGETVVLDLASPLVFLCATVCVWRYRKSGQILSALAWLGLGWLLAAWILPGDWPRHGVPALLVLAPCVGGTIAAAYSCRPSLRHAGSLLLLAITVLVGGFAVRYLDWNPGRPLAPVRQGAVVPPALPTLPLLLERNLSTQERVNIDTDGVDEPIFPLMVQRRDQRFTSLNRIDASAYNLISRASSARGQAYNHPDQFSSYTLLATPGKPTAGVEYLATLGNGAGARDYFGLERDAAHTAPVSANRNVLLTLERERPRGGAATRTRLRLAGLNPPDRMRVEASVVYDDETSAPLGTFTGEGEITFTVAKPFRLLVYRAINVDSGAEMGSAAIVYRPEPDAKIKVLDSGRPSNSNSIFVTDLVLGRESKWINYEGLLPVEGPFPQWDIPYVRWARQPLVTIRIPPIANLSRLQLAFSVRLHVRRKAGLEVLLNGQLLKSYRIEDHVSWLDQTLDLAPQPGENVLEFRDGPINPEPDWLAYLELYPDVKKYLVTHDLPLEAGARQHYEAMGRSEGRTLPTTAKPEPAPDGYYFMFRNIRLEGFKSP